MVGGPFGSKLVSRDYVPDGVPVIRGANLPSDNRFSFENLVFVTEQKVQTDLFGNLFRRFLLSARSSPSSPRTTT